MGTSVREGRAFTDRDALGPGNVVIGKAVADAPFPGGSALGQTLTNTMLQGLHTIVVVVEDILRYDFRDPMYRTYTLEGLVERSMVSLSFTMLTLGIAAALALILGSLGLYGVLSYVVAERTQEIGVRMALGAQAARVRRMVVGQGARVVLLGIVLGLAVAVLATRVLGTLLFGVEAVDSWTFVGMSLAMVAVGAVASYVPARRASLVDPAESMRG